ncbi:hypothetical protein ABZP36_002875 [Zizania latifolia]
MASPAVATPHPSPAVLAHDPRRRLLPRRVSAPILPPFRWHQRYAGHSPFDLGFQRSALQLKVDTKPREVSIVVVSSIMDIPLADWDACAVDSVDPDKFNPFLTHAFLSSLEESGSVVKVSA